MTGNFYNGFSPAKRRAGSNLIRKAVAEGALHMSETCAMCGSRGQVLQWHAERYDLPLTAVPVCLRCHGAIHARFHRPDR